MKKIRELSQPSRHQADVWIVEENGRRMVYKDFRKKGFIGRFIVNREIAFYRKLKGIEGVPEFYGSPESGVMLMEYIDGKPVEKRGGLPASFFEKLSKLLEDIHSRGVLYLDLRHMSNLLVRDGRPFLIDYGTCINAPALVPLLKFIDYGAMLYIKQQVSPELLSRREDVYIRKLNRISRMWFFNKLAGRD